MLTDSKAGDSNTRCLREPSLFKGTAALAPMGIGYLGESDSAQRSDLPSGVC